MSVNGCRCIYYYTPLPLNQANKQHASSKQASKHLSFAFWLLLRLNNQGSTLLKPPKSLGGPLAKSKL